MPVDEIVVQAPPQSFGGAGQSMLFALFPVLGGIGMLAFALVYRNTLFLVIAGAMVVVTIGFGLLMVWSQRRQGKISARRQRRRYREYLRDVEEQLADVADLQRAAAERLHPDLQRELARVPRLDDLWERRPEHPDFAIVRVGRGPVEHAGRPRLDLGHNALADYDRTLVDEAEDLVERWRVLDDQPIEVALDGSGVLSVMGDRARSLALVRALLCHLTVACAPSELRVAVAHDGSDPDGWDWVKWLPHVRQEPGPDDPSGVPLAALAADTAGLKELLDVHVAPRLEQRRTLVAAMPGADPTPVEAPRLVLVVDGYVPADPRSRLALLREAMTHGEDLRVSVICVVDRPEDEPSDTGVRIVVPARGFATIEETGPGKMAVERVEPDAASPGLAESLARSLAPVRLDEQGDGGHARAEAGLLPLLGIPSVEAVDPEGDWRGRPRALALRTTIGVAETGEPLELDLKQAAEGGMGPHGLIIGATGSGKSELLRTLVAGLALTHSPDELAFVFVDFKGGAALAELAELPHTAGMITNLQTDLRLIDRMHDALYAEQERRQQLLRDAGNIDDAAQYRRRRDEDPSLPPLPDLLVIIDEFGELLAARPEFIELFVAIGRVGRSLGIHLLFSSQRFEEGRLRGLESHIGYRICLRTYTPLESKAVLGTADAYVLPAQPGLGYLKVDTSIYERFRTALVSRPLAATDDGETRPAVVPFGAPGSARHEPPADLAEDPDNEMRLIVERLRAARGGRVHQVWLEPLPTRTPLDQLPSEAGGDLEATIGLTDAPRAQRQEPLSLDFTGTAGHLAVVGAPRSGKSTLLRTLVLALARRHSPDEFQFLAVDLGGGGLRALEGLPHCGAVASKVDRDLVRQVVRHLRATIEEREGLFRRRAWDSMADARAARRRGEQDTVADLFLIVDGWAQLRREFVDLDLEVEELASAGLAFGVHVVIAASRWPEMRPSLSDNLGGRLELRLNEPLESEIGRKQAEKLPSDVPGRGIVWEGTEFQTALPRLDGQAVAEGLGDAVADAAARIAAQWADHVPAPPVRVLPLVLSAEVFAPAAHEPGVPIGVEELRLEPVRLDLTGADPHFVVLGDAESGRTNLLRAIVRGLVAREAPDRVQIALIDPRSTLEELAELPHVVGHATTTAASAELAGRAAATASGRSARGGDPPDLYVVADDYDLLVGAEGNPLAALSSLLAHGRDSGLHVVLARRVGGAGRSMYGGDPFFQRLVELRSPGLILSGEPGEGPLLDNQRAQPQPPGRGLLVRRGRRPVLVQTVLLAADAPTTTERPIGRIT